MVLKLLSLLENNLDLKIYVIKRLSEKAVFFYAISLVGLSAYKFTTNNTFIYVCVNGTCKLPVAELDKALKQILK